MKRATAEKTPETGFWADVFVMERIAPKADGARTTIYRLSAAGAHRSYPSASGASIDEARDNMVACYHSAKAAGGKLPPLARIRKEKGNPSACGSIFIEVE